MATKLRWNSNRNWFNNETHELSSKHLLALRTTAGQALITDKPPSGVDLSGALREFSQVIYAHELGFENFDGWLFKHDVVEASTAVKGQMLRHLLLAGADFAVYLDPDIAVFHSLDSVLDRLQHASIVLTPHQTSPNRLPRDVRDNELVSLTHGVFNLGFCAVANDVTGRAFADWWSERLYDACYADLVNGIFTDQKWCDLVPALFERVYVERDPGCNVASWNITTRRLEITGEGNIRVNGHPLKFYHFTKVNSLGDYVTEKYAGENLEIMEIWNWYKRAIRDARVDGIPAGYWAYGAFDNGEKIPKPAREFFRDRVDLNEAFSNPFQTEGNSYYGWLQRHRSDLLVSDQRGFQPV